MIVSRPLLSAAILLLVLALNAPRVGAETSVAISGDKTVDTRAIELTAPASESIITSPLNIAFFLPRTAEPGSVKLVFTGTVVRELTLAAAHETAGAHNFSFDPANPTGTGAIATGDPIPDGTYTLTLYYRDGTVAPPASNPATNAVIDQTAPVLTVPANISVAATNDAGAVVSYPAATATDAVGVISLTYSRASGSIFPIGTTTVTVTAKDAANNSAVASFTVTVTGVQIGVEHPPGTDLIDAVLAPLDFGLVFAGGSKSLTFTIRNHGTAELTGLAVTKGANGTPGDFTVGAPGASTLSPNTATSFDVTFSPAGTGVRTATLLIANNDPDENPFEINLAGRQATALEVWRQTWFGAPGDTGTGANLNDADGDGMVNLLEFATASDPTVYTPSPWQLVKNGNALEFTYTRPTAALQDLTYTIETGEVLAGPWSAADASTTKVLDDNGVLQQVKTTLPSGAAGQMFLRLRVTRF